MIEKQRGIIDHLAGYAPAGVGSPWFTIGPRNVNGRVKALAVHPTDSRHRVCRRGKRRRVEEHRRRPVVAPAVGRAGHDGLRCARHRAKRARHDLRRHGRVDAGVGPRAFPARASSSAPTPAPPGRSAPPSCRAASRKSSSRRPTPIVSTWPARAASSVQRMLASPGRRCAPVRSPTPSSIPTRPTRSTSTCAPTASTRRPTAEPPGPSWPVARHRASAADWIRLAIGRSGAAGSNLVLAKRSGTIYRTTDGGTNWTTLAGSHGDSPSTNGATCSRSRPTTTTSSSPAEWASSARQMAARPGLASAGCTPITIARSSRPRTRTSSTPATTAAYIARPTRARRGRRPAMA